MGHYRIDFFTHTLYVVLKEHKLGIQILDNNMEYGRVVCGVPKLCAPMLTNSHFKLEFRIVTQNYCHIQKEGDVSLKFKNK